jgi:regulator of replication initiation timing
VREDGIGGSLAEEIARLRSEVATLYVDIARFREELGTMIEDRLRQRIDVVVSQSRLEKALEATDRLTKAAAQMSAFSEALKKHGGELRSLTRADMEKIAQKLAAMEKRYNRMSGRARS